tara:strand:- start:408 stop:782 length:375 start_codon:yes stop_codon:yes gene_type:complete
MTIKLLLLKSGEDIIADVSEMVVGEEQDRRVVGYFFDRPCVVRMKDPNMLPDQTVGNTQRAGFEVSLYPWMPLSKEDRIPVTADWVITMVEPVTKLKEMYQKDVATYGKDNQDNSVSKSTDADK